MGNSNVAAHARQEWKIHQSQFQALGLRRSEVKRLYRVFDRIDVDGSKEISLLELLDYLDAVRCTTHSRALSI